MTQDPSSLFREWIETDEVALATATADGRPSLRMVLLKAADEHGFMFFTNYESRKGLDLSENPQAALLFREPDLQVRIEGRVERVEPAESDAYWQSRPPASRRSAAASRQSQPIGSRAELEAAVAAQPRRAGTRRRGGGAIAWSRRRTSSGGTATTACTNVTCSGDATTVGSR